MATAVGGFSQFGFAFIEVGPLTESAQQESEVTFQPDSGRVILATPEQNPGLSVVPKLEGFAKQQACSTPIMIRFDGTITPEQIEEVVAKHDCTDFCYVVPWQSLMQSSPQPTNALLLALVPADCNAEQLASLPWDSIAGVFIDGSLSETRRHRIMERGILGLTKRCVDAVRDLAGSGAIIIATGGVYEPVDALVLRQAGADLVGVGAGMVSAGPGLSKRCNELLAQTSDSPARYGPSVSRDDDTRAARHSWFWAFLMGVSMFGGGILALIIALTRIVLPYDESVVAMTRDELMLVNDRLLDFMAHDRVTLAGTMLCVGTLYSALAWFAIRYGIHWARQAVVWSAFVGFFSFFLFLGFGYFDPFHAFVTTILFQFLLLTLYASLRKRDRPIRLDLYNDGKWRRSQWGQFLFLVEGFVLIAAGLIICWIGISSVFVPEDMEFLCTTPEKLIEANPQLLSLVAHDRATFGGMLICSGITVFLTSLWGFRRGHAWLWWMLVTSGLFGFLCTIWIHHRVGYTSTRHLLPAYGGLVWLCLAATLSFSYLHDRVLAPVDGPAHFSH